MKILNIVVLPVGKRIPVCKALAAFCTVLSCSLLGRRWCPATLGRRLLGFSPCRGCLVRWGHWGRSRRSRWPRSPGCRRRPSGGRRSRARRRSGGRSWRRNPCCQCRGHTYPFCSTSGGNDAQCRQPSGAGKDTWKKKRISNNKVCSVCHSKTSLEFNKHTSVNLLNLYWIQRAGFYTLGCR